MKTALIGASGNVGSRLLAELVRRGHTVTAIVRRPEDLPSGKNVAAKKGDVGDPEALAALLAGHDIIVTAAPFRSMNPQALIHAVRASAVKRWLAVGGAGSLEVAAGERLVDQPDFPEIWREEALKGAEFLDTLRRVDDLDWTMLSPSAILAPGERTGTFRLGDDQLIVDDEGESRISLEDFAVAMVDELEKPAHSRRRFTVGY